MPVPAIDCETETLLNFTLTATDERSHSSQSLQNCQIISKANEFHLCRSWLQAINDGRADFGEAERAIEVNGIGVGERNFEKAALVIQRG